MAGRVLGGGVEVARGTRCIEHPPHLLLEVDPDKRSRSGHRGGPWSYEWAPPRSTPPHDLPISSPSSTTQDSLPVSLFLTPYTRCAFGSASVPLCPRRGTSRYPLAAAVPQPPRAAPGVPRCPPRGSRCTRFGAVVSLPVRSGELRLRSQRRSGTAASSDRRIHRDTDLLIDRAGSA
jgi:hypothetical protein